MFKLWKYILKAHFGPFFLSVTLLMFIFLLQFLMKYLDQLTGKGLSASVIAELIMLNLAWMVVLAVPMGVLVATLMAFGGLASSNQITAMKSSGISLYQIIAPVVFSSIIICFLLISFNNDVLPDANHRTKILTEDISKKKPTLSLVPGMFIQLLHGHSILVKQTFENSNDLLGVTIVDYSKPMMTSTITAKKGTISFSKDYKKLIMDLTDGEIHQINNQFKNQYRISRFEKHRIVMEAEGFNFQRTGTSNSLRGDREMNVQMMQQIVDSMHNLQKIKSKKLKEITGKYLEEIVDVNLLSTYNDIYKIPLQGIKDNPYLEASIRSDIVDYNNYEKTIRMYLVEIHKKFSIPVACIVFVFIGAPLGIMSRRGTFGMGASLSLGFFFFYYGCLKIGENLADRAILEPWLGMWMANIILGVIGFYLTFRTARENLTINWNMFNKFIPKSWRVEKNNVQEE